MSKRQDIYCCKCRADVRARLTDGSEIYPHRPDLYDLPLWKCDTCRNYVGCHHKSGDPTKPLGCIAFPSLLAARKRIHAVIDPIWKGKTVSRGRIYAYISGWIGEEYHTGEIRTLEEARDVYRLAVKMHNGIVRYKKLTKGKED